MGVRPRTVDSVAVAMFQIVPPCGLCHVAAGATLQPPAGAMLRPVPCCGRCPNTIVWSRDRSAGRSTITIGLFFREPHAAHAAGHSAQSRFCCSSGNRTLHTQPVTMHSHEFVCFRESQAAHAASHHVQSRWRNRFGRILYRCDNHGLCHIAAGATLQTQAGATRQTVAEDRCRELFPRAQFKNCACNTRPWIRACPWDTALVHLGCRPGRTVSQHIELTCKASLSHMLEPTP
jgi:hypothetical protein